MHLRDISSPRSLSKVSVGSLRGAIAAEFTAAPRTAPGTPRGARAGEKITPVVQHFETMSATCTPSGRNSSQIRAGSGCIYASPRLIARNNRKVYSEARAKPNRNTDENAAPSVIKSPSSRFHSPPKRVRAPSMITADADEANGSNAPALRSNTGNVLRLPPSATKSTSKTRLAVSGLAGSAGQHRTSSDNSLVASSQTRSTDASSSATAIVGVASSSAEPVTESNSTTPARQTGVRGAAWRQMYMRPTLSSAGAGSSAVHASAKPAVPTKRVGGGFSSPSLENGGTTVTEGQVTARKRVQARRRLTQVHPEQVTIKPATVDVPTNADVDGELQAASSAEAEGQHRAAAPTLSTDVEQHVDNLDSSAHASSSFFSPCVPSGLSPTIGYTGASRCSSGPRGKRRTPDLDDDDGSAGETDADTSIATADDGTVVDVDRDAAATGRIDEVTDVPAVAALAALQAAACAAVNPSDSTGLAHECNSGTASHDDSIINATSIVNDTVNASIAYSVASEAASVNTRCTITFASPRPLRMAMRRRQTKTSADTGAGISNIATGNDAAFASAALLDSRYRRESSSARSTVSAASTSSSTSMRSTKSAGVGPAAPMTARKAARVARMNERARARIQAMGLPMPQSMARVVDRVAAGPTAAAAVVAMDCNPPTTHDSLVDVGAALPSMISTETLTQQLSVPGAGEWQPVLQDDPSTRSAEGGRAVSAIDAAPSVTAAACSLSSEVAESRAADDAAASANTPSLGNETSNDACASSLLSGGASTLPSTVEEGSELHPAGPSLVPEAACINPGAVEATENVESHIDGDRINGASTSPQPAAVATSGSPHDVACSPASTTLSTSMSPASSPAASMFSPLMDEVQRGTLFGLGKFTPVSLPATSTPPEADAATAGPGVSSSSPAAGSPGLAAPFSFTPSTVSDRQPSPFDDIDWRTPGNDDVAGGDCLSSPSSVRSKVGETSPAGAMLAMSTSAVSTPSLHPGSVMRHSLFSHDGRQATPPGNSGFMFGVDAPSPQQVPIVFGNRIITDLSPASAPSTVRSSSTTPETPAPQPSASTPDGLQCSFTDKSGLRNELVCGNDADLNATVPVSSPFTPAPVYDMRDGAAWPWLGATVAIAPVCSPGTAGMIVVAESPRDVDAASSNISSAEAGEAKAATEEFAEQNLSSDIAATPRVIAGIECAECGTVGLLQDADATTIIDQFQLNAVDSWHTSVAKSTASSAQETDNGFHSFDVSSPIGGGLLAAKARSRLAGQGLDRQEERDPTRDQTEDGAAIAVASPSSTGGWIGDSDTAMHSAVAMHGDFDDCAESAELAAAGGRAAHEMAPSSIPMDDAAAFMSSDHCNERELIADVPSPTAAATLAMHERRNGADASPVSGDTMQMSATVKLDLTELVSHEPATDSADNCNIAAIHAQVEAVVVEINASPVIDLIECGTAVDRFTYSCAATDGVCEASFLFEANVTPAVDEAVVPARFELPPLVAAAAPADDHEVVQASREGQGDTFLPITNLAEAAEQAVTPDLISASADHAALRRTWIHMATIIVSDISTRPGTAAVPIKTRVMGPKTMQRRAWFNLAPSTLQAEIDAGMRRAGLMHSRLYQTSHAARVVGFAATHIAGGIGRSPAGWRPWSSQGESGGVKLLSPFQPLTSIDTTLFNSPVPHTETHIDDADEDGTMPLRMADLCSADDTSAEAAALPLSSDASPAEHAITVKVGHAVLVGKGLSQHAVYPLFTSYHDDNDTDTAVGSRIIKSRVRYRQVLHAFEVIREKVRLASAAASAGPGAIGAPELLPAAVDSLSIKDVHAQLSSFAFPSKVAIGSLRPKVLESRRSRIQAFFDLLTATGLVMADEVMALLNVDAQVE